MLPFLLSNFVDQSTAYYTFLIQIIEICQIVFSPVISKETVTALEGLIEEHLKLFKQLFPDKNITPKQHYGIHIPSHIISLGLPARASCFSFESAHNYFKELAQKQNFKSLPFFLAKRHQKMECCNFINNQLTPESHLLFATEKKFGVIKLTEDNDTVDIQIKFQRSGLLPGVTLKSVYVVSWNSCFGTKYKSKALLTFDADPATLLPEFGKIERIYQVLGFIYFELTKFNTEGFSKTFQSYEICENINNSTTIVSYDNLLDYNV